MQNDFVTFSIVMPVYLGEYKGAAREREKKLIRAIESVLAQTIGTWELLIISDGCQKSIDIITEADYLEDERVKLYSIKRDSLWAGTPRNSGILKSTNEYIIYLDADDAYRSIYLESLSDEIIQDKHDWYVVDDYIYTNNGFSTRFADIDKLGKCGTSNVIHKRELGAMWPQRGNYAHDFIFINTLKSLSLDYIKLKSCGYFVMHIPSVYDR